MRRPRGPGGRFLTADEVANLERKQAEGGEGSEDMFDEGGSESDGRSMKRKAESEEGTSMGKKAKRGGTSDDAEDDDADEDDEG